MRALIVVALVALAGCGEAIDKYQRKSRTLEATQGIKKIYDGVRRHLTENGELPASVGPTPAPGSCCRGEGQRCAPDASLWYGTWLEVAFSMEDPYLYSYQLDTSATGFTARALGDLDCDGSFSTFEISGIVQPDGSLAFGALTKRHELE